MNILYMIIILLTFILILLIAFLVTGRKLISPFKVLLISIFLLAAGGFLDSKEYKAYDNALDYYITLFSPLFTESGPSTIGAKKSVEVSTQKQQIKESVLIDTPVINQMPELPRGCEVTSLAMLLQHAGIHVDKMTLADRIKKNPAVYRVKNGNRYFGDPNDGFVGDMYSFDNPGLGVYHKPIAELAEQFFPGFIIDLTGSRFKELKIHLSDERPVWVIINSHYKKLSPDYFQTWHTSNGLIEITYKEHSVLITGYDQNYIYFNDPLTGVKNKKAPIKDFEESWVQMGKQAITYLEY